MFRTLVMAMMGAFTIACEKARVPEDRAAADSVQPLTVAEWEMVSLDGAPPVTGTRITVTTAPDGLGGYAGCNWFGMRYRISDGRLRVDDAERTARGCLRPGVEEQETRLLAHLGRAATYEIERDTLRFVDSAGSSLVTLRRRVPLAMNPDALSGTSWRLSSWTRRNVPERPRITLAFRRETIHGFAGCRGYTGEWRGTGDRIDFPRLSMKETECANMSMNTFEGEFTTVLSETTHYRLGEASLELFTVGGDTARFVPAR